MKSPLHPASSSAPMAKTATHRPKRRIWYARVAGLPLLALIITLLWSVLLALDSSWGRSSLQEWSADRTEETVLASDRYDATHTYWARAAPRIAWIDFDEDSIQAIRATAADEQATTRRPIAELLSWLQQPGTAAARLVYLDLGVLYDAPQSENKLVAAALAEWNRNPRAPPLMLYAGPACATAGSAEPVKYFDPAVFEAVAIPRPTATAGPTGKILWSCPLFKGLDQKFWHCVTGPADRGSPTLALPSPAWGAIAARDSPGNFYDRGFLTGLASAGRACADATATEVKLPSGTAFVPGWSHIRLTFDPLNPRTQDGEDQLVHRIPARLILENPNYAHDSVAGRVVVIGASDVSRGHYDTVATGLGQIPGPLVVAAAIRGAWAEGYPQAPTWWRSGFAGTLLAVAAWGLVYCARWARRRAGGLRRMKTKRPLATVITNPHVIAAIFIPASAWVIVAVSRSMIGLDFVKMAACLFIVEWLFVLDGVTEELSDDTH